MTRLAAELEMKDWGEHEASADQREQSARGEVAGDGTLELLLA